MNGIPAMIERIGFVCSKPSLSVSMFLVKFPGMFHTCTSSVITCDTV